MDRLQHEHADLPIKTSPAQRDRILRSVLDRNPVKTLNTKVYWGAAAIFVALVGLTLSAIFLLPAQTITQLAAKGEKKEIILEDGTHVFLNGNSSITYRSSFEDKRHITLVGEAFFDVARDTTRPFTVNMGDVTVRVLGTSFNINSYDKDRIKVSVNSGKVAVRSTQVDTLIHLIKNQQVEFFNSLTAKVSTADSDDDILWTKNIISLKETTLADTATILENWYDVQIGFADPTIGQETISGKFKKEKLENIMTSIALLKNLEIEYKSPKQILIRKKEEQ